MPIDKVTLLANCLYRCGLIHDVRFCENEIEGYLSDQGIPFKKWNKAIPNATASEFLSVSTTLDETSLPRFIDKLWKL